MQGRDYCFFVYIAASRSLQLYIGVTNSLQRRMREHRELHPGSYTARYNIDRLVYFERHQYVINALSRETELKSWNRSRKLELIKTTNPTWRDLAFDWESAASSEKTTADSSALLRNDKNRSMRE